MPDKPPPAYITEEAPPPVPPIKVVMPEQLGADVSPAGNKKLHFSRGLIILIVTVAIISVSATAWVFIAKPQSSTEEAPVPAIVTMVVTATPAQQSPSQTPGNISITPAQPQRLLTNKQFGFTLITPDSWLTTETPDQITIADPTTGSLARLTISYGPETHESIVSWFDENVTNAVKQKAYTNPQGVELLETASQDATDRLRYYFIANGRVVILSFRTGSSDSVNKQLQLDYGGIIDSVTVIGDQSVPAQNPIVPPTSQ